MSPCSIARSPDPVAESPVREAAPVAVALQGLSHDYGPGAPALRDVTLTIRRGECVGLIGPSGAGKSTLLRCLNGLVLPAAGAIEVLGRDVRAMAEGDRVLFRRQVGMIFQDFALIDGLSALTNVLVGRLGYVRVLPSLVRSFPPDDVDRAMAALAEVGLSGYEGRQVRRLSGGQKQRVGIARTIVQDARLILGDEPTANLDMRTANDVLALLVSVGRRRENTLVLSLHDVRAARRHCTRIVALRDGAVVWDGDAADFGDAEVEAVFYGPAVRLAQEGREEDGCRAP